MVGAALVVAAVADIRRLARTRSRSNSASTKSFGHSNSGIKRGRTVNHVVRFLFANVPRLSRAIFVVFASLCFVGITAAQTSAVNASVPNGTASNEKLRLTLRDAINMALRYNLGAIESREDAQRARGQRLIALSYLLPQVSAALSETVGQTSLATFGVKSSPIVPSILGPYAYGKVDASLSQTLFSLESIQRFRSARAAEQAAQRDSAHSGVGL